MILVTGPNITYLAFSRVLMWVVEALLTTLVEEIADVLPSTYHSGEIKRVATDPS